MRKCSKPPPPPPRIHRCDVCEARGAWGEGWLVYGSHLLADYDRSALVVTCSEACRKSDKVKPLLEHAREMEKLAYADFRKFLRETTDPNPQRYY